MLKQTAIIAPNFGLFYDRPSVAIPKKGLVAGENFRVRDGRLNNFNLGWTEFSSESWLPLNGPIMGIERFQPRGGTEQLIFVTPSDIYKYVSGTPDSVVFLTPTYETGTASCSGGTTVTGTGTSWDGNVSAGDFISFGASENDPSATWYEIDSVTNNTALELTAAGPTTGGAVAYTIRTIFSGDRANVWDFDIFVNDGASGSDLWFATNGIEHVATWDGSASQVTIQTGLNFTCKRLASYSNMMIYANITDGGTLKPTSMINSHVGYPLQAGALGAGIASQFVVHGGTDEIKDVRPLGDTLAIYSAEHVVTAQFAGDPYVFIFRAVTSDVGPISSMAIADFGDYHEFIGNDTMYRFDGASVREINSHVWKAILRQSDPARREYAFAVFDDQQTEVIWAQPLTTDADVGDTTGQSEHAFSEHYIENPEQDNEFDSPWGKRDFPFTATGLYQRESALTWDQLTDQWKNYNFQWNDQFFALDFPQILVGDKDGEIWIYGSAQTANSVDMPSYARFGRMPTGTGREKNLLWRIYPFSTELQYTLTVNAFLYNHMNGSVEDTETMTFDMSHTEEGHFITPFRRFRYFEVQYGTDGDPWEIAGYDYDIMPGGTR